MSKNAYYVFLLSSLETFLLLQLALPNRRCRRLPTRPAMTCKQFAFHYIEYYSFSAFNVKCAVFFVVGTTNICMRTLIGRKADDCHFITYRLDARRGKLPTFKMLHYHNYVHFTSESHAWRCHYNREGYYT